MKRMISFLLFIIFYASLHAQPKILYSRSQGKLNTGNTLDVMIYDPVQKTTKVLLKGTIKGRGEYNAVTSPDNTTIIFNTYRFSGWQLGIGEFDGNGISNIKKLTDRNHYEYCAKFSPDGSKLAYQEYDWGKRKSNIYIANNQGKDATYFTTSNISDQNIDWTKDSQSIVFTYLKDDKLSIYLKSLDGQVFKKISTHNANDFAVSTSKKSNQIAFLSDKTGKIDLFIMDLDGHNLTNLTPNIKTLDSNINSIWTYKTSWSQDGKQIVFTAMINQNLEIFIINADGSDLTQITNNNHTDMTPFWTN
ncbi:PD40 domain-containing protein [Aquimarina sp. AU474]|uniref:PD40 domain-containing protein n=1 Tax=Aquimarina sp. AU474 TaxID=2108529 RepID=UPI000D6872C5|nr:PD40 domain-containing protein [Aquimarina sp. AU474]